MFYIIFQSIMLTLTIIWSVPFILVKFFGFQLYQIKEKQNISTIANKITIAAIQTDDNKPNGFFFGKWFIGLFHDNKNEYGESSSELWLLCKKQTYKSLIMKDHEIELENNIEKEKISIWSRTGNYNWLKYLKRDLDVTQYIPRENQGEIIKVIKKIYYSKITKSCVVYLHGNTGIGKSMLGILLAKTIEGSIVRTFNPTEPGDTIQALYSEINPDEKQPLVIVLDEFDIILDKIHKTIPMHKNITTQIRDKISWNQFFDDINLGLYPYTIFVLTSNMTPDIINEKYDPSYIRSGRVDKIIKMD